MARRSLVSILISSLAISSINCNGCFGKSDDTDAAVESPRDGGARAAPSASSSGRTVVHAEPELPFGANLNRCFYKPVRLDGNADIAFSYDCNIPQGGSPGSIANKFNNANVGDGNNYLNVGPTSVVGADGKTIDPKNFRPGEPNDVYVVTKLRTRPAPRAAGTAKSAPSSDKTGDAVDDSAPSGGDSLEGFVRQGDSRDARHKYGLAGSVTPKSSPGSIADGFTRVDAGDIYFGVIHKDVVDCDSEQSYTGDDGGYVKSFTTKSKPCVLARPRPRRNASSGGGVGDDSGDAVDGEADAAVESPRDGGAGADAGTGSPTDGGVLRGDRSVGSGGEFTYRPPAREGDPVTDDYRSAVRRFIGEHADVVGNARLRYVCDRNGDILSADVDARATDDTVEALAGTLAGKLVGKNSPLCRDGLYGSVNIRFGTGSAGRE